MKKVTESINCILAEWNPIEVPQNIANEEYRHYVSVVINSIENSQDLMNCLKDILVNELELHYDLTSKVHLEELKQVCNKLIQVYHEAISSRL